MDRTGFREDVMYAVVRDYSVSRATGLFALLEERKDEIESIMSGVTGFVAYTLIRTDDGGVAVTVCQDKTGTDESVKKARDWIQANASHLKTRPPVVIEGSVVLKLG